MKRILQISFLISCLFTIDNFAQEGYWIRSKVTEKMTNPTELLKLFKNMNPAHHSFTGKTDDMGITAEYRHYSTVDSKNHIQRGHVSWNWPNPQQLNPGQKLTVKGSITNLANEGSFTAWVVLGYGFTGPDAGKPTAAPPGGATSISGTVEVPKPGVDNNGNYKPMTMTFILAGGNEWCYAERNIIFEWVSKGKDAPRDKTTNNLPNLNTLSSSFPKNDKIQVDFTAFPGGSGDWIGLYKKGSGDRQYVSRKYTDSKKDGQITFTDQLAPGEYELRAFANNGYQLICKSPIFTVTEKIIEDGNFTPFANIKPSSSRYFAGNEIDVNYDGFPGNLRDWIGLYKKTSDNKQFVSWKYTNGQKEGKMTFTDQLAPGEYEFRAFANDGYVWLGTSPIFTIEQKPQNTTQATFDGDWFIRSSNSLLRIRPSDTGYSVQFIESGVTHSIGFGYIVKNRLVISFTRADGSGDGGIGSYELANGNLVAKHLNSNLTNRWQGTYTR